MIGRKTFKGVVDCPVCDQKIFYTRGQDTPRRSSTGRYRKLCRACQRWVHCACYGSSDTDRCPNCLGVNIRELRTAARKLDHDGSFQEACLIVMASALVGADETTVSTFTGIPVEAVRPRAERLRRAGIWTNSGALALELDLDMDDPRHGSMMIILYAMCAEGLIDRASEEPGEVRSVMEV